MSENAESTTWSQSTLFAEDFLASHTVLPGSEKARQMTVTSGRNIAALLPNSGPLGCLLRTCLESERLSSTRCYLTWKVWTTPLGRLLFRLLPSTPRTEETGSGLWPTPKASQDGISPKTLEMVRMGKAEASLARVVLTPEMWPTPKASEVWAGVRGLNAQGGPGLTEKVGGSLNPTWVEWLQGFPMDWTEVD